MADHDTGPAVLPSCSERVRTGVLPTAAESSTWTGVTVTDPPAGGVTSSSNRQVDETTPTASITTAARASRTAGAVTQEVIDVFAVLNALRAAWPPKELTDYAA